MNLMRQMCCVFFEHFNDLPDSLGGRHLCKGCCLSRQHCTEKGDHGLKRLLLRRQPVVPQIQKWTKLGPATDYFLLGMHSWFLLRLFEVAFCKLSFTEKVTAPIIIEMLPSSLFKV